MPSVALVGRLSVRNCQQLCADAVQPVSEAWVSWPQQFLCVLMLVGYFRARGGVCRDGMALFGCLEQPFRMEMVVSSMSQMKN